MKIENSYFKINADGTPTGGISSDGTQFGDFTIPYINMALNANGELYEFYELSPNGEGKYEPMESKQLESSKSSRIEELNSDYDAKIEEGVVCLNSIKMKSDKQTLAELKVASDISTLELFVFEDFDGVPFYDVTFSDFAGMLSDIEVNIADLELAKFKAQDEVRAATAIEDIEGIELSNYTVAARTKLVEELLIQAVIVEDDLTAADQNILDKFINNCILGSLTGTYGEMPAGRDLYDSLDETVGQEIEVMITKHIYGNTYFNIDSQLFSTVK